MFLSGSRFHISLFYVDMHCYIPLNQIIEDACSGRNLTNTLKYLYAQELRDRPWIEVKLLVEKVQEDVCGHDSYSDDKMILKRSRCWLDYISKYVCIIHSSFPTCKTTCKPQDYRKVSITSINSLFSTVVCVYHLLLEDYRVLHAMVLTNRSLAGVMLDEMDPPNPHN